MKLRWHAFVGWVTAQIGIRMARRAIAQKKRAISENKTKIGAAGAIALVFIGGMIAVKGMSGDGDD
jgi:hypothetical protein